MIVEIFQYIILGSLLVIIFFQRKSIRSYIKANDSMTETNGRLEKLLARYVTNNDDLIDHLAKSKVQVTTLQSISRQLKIDHNVKVYELQRQLEIYQLLNRANKKTPATKKPRKAVPADATQMTLQPKAQTTIRNLGNIANVGKYPNLGIGRKDITVTEKKDNGTP